MSDLIERSRMTDAEYLRAMIAAMKDKTLGIEVFISYERLEEIALSLSQEPRSASDDWPCFICHKVKCGHNDADEIKWCEQSSAWDAATQLMNALGVSAGGLGAMTADIIKERDDARHQRDTVTRKLAAYEHAFDNILTIIDGKADASVEEGRYVGNDYGSIQIQIDEARR